MPLWGIGTTNEKKPTWLSDAEKERTFADDRGWVYKHPDGTEEVLVAIGQLSGTDGSTGLAAPTVERVRYNTTTPAQGDMLYLYVYYNEPVTVTGTPTVAVTGAGNTLSYDESASDLDSGRLAFGVDTTAQTGTVTLAASASITLAGGTITDETDGATAAELTLNNTERVATIQV